jgi:hypothetical protein
MFAPISLLPLCMHVLKKPNLVNRQVNLVAFRSLYTIDILIILKKLVYTLGEYFSLPPPIYIFGGYVKYIWYVEKIKLL